MKMLPASPEDAFAVAQTRRIVWEETYRGIYPDEKLDGYDTDAYAKADREKIADPNHHYYLFWDEGQCAGYFSFGPSAYDPYKDFTLLINHLYIRREYRGKGLGKQAFSCIRQYCSRMGIEKFACGCNVHNLPAIGFYTHMGGVPGNAPEFHEDKSDDIIYFEFTR